MCIRDRNVIMPVQIKTVQAHFVIKTEAKMKSQKMWTVKILDVASIRKIQNAGFPEV